MLPVTMMHQQGDFRYAAGPTYQAVQLTYVGNKLAMLLVVPNSGTTLAQMETALGAGGRQPTIQSALAPNWLDVDSPRFSFRWL